MCELPHTALPILGGAWCMSRCGGSGEGGRCLTYAVQANLLLQGVKTDVTVGKAEEYVGDRGRARGGTGQVMRNG